MFKKKVWSFLILSGLCLSLGMFLAAGSAKAITLGETLRNGLNGSGGINNVAVNVYGSNYQKYANLADIVVVVINGVLGLLGIIFLSLTFYAGFLWMTAQGNEDNVTKAKNILTTSIIGIIIIVAAYAITNFVLTAILI